MSGISETAAAENPEADSLVQSDLFKPLPAQEDSSIRRKRFSDVLIRVIAGVFVGGCAAVGALIAHIGPVNYEWVGMILAALLILAGGWFAVELGGKFGAVGYFVAAAAVTAGFMLFPLQNDVTAIQEQLASRIWIFAAPILAFVPIATAFRKKSR
ncbi:hypothetical protein RQN30_04965 [Arcanobacterium hippocoleae]